MCSIDSSQWLKTHVTILEEESGMKELKSSCTSQALAEWITMDQVRREEPSERVFTYQNLFKKSFIPNLNINPQMTYTVPLFINIP